MTKQVFKGIIMGLPGSGKTTIAMRMVKHFNLHYISSYHILRQKIEQDANHGQKLEEYLTARTLVRDKLMTAFILDELDTIREKPWLIEGFPRTVHQCVVLWKKHPLNFAINLLVPNDVIIERISKRWTHLDSGRVYNIDYNAPKVAGKDDETGEDLVQTEEDKPEFFEPYLKDYENQLKPAYKFLRDKGVVYDFEGSSDEMWTKIREEFGKRFL